MCVDDGWFKQITLARVQLIGLWRWVRLRPGGALTYQCATGSTSHKPRPSHTPSPTWHHVTLSCSVLFNYNYAIWLDIGYCNSYL